ncbi:cation diffusion facilitator family transporter [Brachybacterium sp. YJGR34]|uniref:cation diffusion facilitator family transporter n=1 Tax=Brachybacterium sp. YJGR34 TaxID=2059911 RepID=UPI000E0A34ED|nr:cation transporter [Brachybacterium sp. YJGR34]
MSARGEPAPEFAAHSGRDALPEEQRSLLSRAIRLEWISIACTAVTVTMVASLAGQSQAMKAAWIEDALALLPPIAFLVATRRIRRGPTRDYPYGHHRSIGVAHLVAAVALLNMGVFLLVDSTISLVTVERPPVGLTVLFGQAVWSGWLMIAVLVIACIPPVILGRLKLALAEPLHDKVLYADSDMNKADWSSSLASIAGIMGIGLGLWWADAVAALLIALSISRDGVKNLRAAIRGLTDGVARTFDEEEPHPLIARLEQRAQEAPWVLDAAGRVRDEGHVFHVEMFVVPASGEVVTGAMCEDLRASLHDLDWKVHDVVIAPVAELPEHQAFHRG